MMELCPSGPLYLELGNGIQAVLKRLSTQSRARTSSIEKLVLRGRYCRFIDTHVSGEEIHDVLRMASCLPNLKRLSLLRLRVPITAITQTLQLGQKQQAKKQDLGGGGLIKELELRSICLWGSWKEMEELADALAEHTSLVKISLADCRPEGGTCDKLDALLTRGLSRMVALREVELDMMELSRWFSSIESFQLFLKEAQNKKMKMNLKRLSLSYMRLPDTYIMAMAEALTTTTTPTTNPTSTIEELYLDRCDSLSPQSVFVMANMLQRNTSLKQLHLVLKNYEDSIPIANALHSARKTTRLHTLLLRTYHHHPHNVSKAVYRAFYQMLQENYVLQELEMFHGNHHNGNQNSTATNRSATATSTRTTADGAGSNNITEDGGTTTTTVSSSTCDHNCDDYWSVLQFYLQLNRAGRGKLMRDDGGNSGGNDRNNMRVLNHDGKQDDENHDYRGGRGGGGGAGEATNEEWIRTILKSRRDLNCSFYFISQNPSVLAAGLQ